MTRLVSAFPALESHVVSPEESRSGRATINFADPLAVRALNQALLVADYGVQAWKLPEGRLCPPVPGRADYIHHVADVLADATESGAPPRGAAVRGFDVGTGASFIYPLLGASSYGWSFVASESDRISCESAEDNRAANADALPSLHQSEVRFQGSQGQVLAGVRGLDEELDFAMCNPPFYGSADAFMRENARKLKGLAESVRKRGGAPQDAGSTGERGAADAKAGGRRRGSDNFGGGETELWCPGGEVAFVNRLIAESRPAANSVLWFSSIVSRAEHLPKLKAVLSASQPGAPAPAEMRTVEIGLGVKRTSILFWTFQESADRRTWAKRRGWA